METKMFLQIVVNKTRLLEEKGFVVVPFPGEDLNNPVTALIVAPKEQPQFAYRVDKDKVDKLLQMDWLCSPACKPPPELEEGFKAASELREKYKDQFTKLFNDVVSAYLSILEDIFEEKNIIERYSNPFQCESAHPVGEGMVVRETVQREFVLPLGEGMVRVELPFLWEPAAWGVLAAATLAGTPVFVKTLYYYVIKVITPQFRNFAIMKTLNTLSTNEKLKKMVWNTEICTGTIDNCGVSCS